MVYRFINTWYFTGITIMFIIIIIFKSFVIDLIICLRRNNDVDDESPSDMSSEFKVKS